MRRDGVRECGSEGEEGGGSEEGGVRREGGSEGGWECGSEGTHVSTSVW